jgi:pimeloyl-ACP methyl ester carboxylesterase
VIEGSSGAVSAKGCPVIERSNASAIPEIDPSLPTVVFIHGIGGGAKMWAPQMTSFSAAPHSEGITYKSSNNEVVMCLRVGRMGPVKR